MMTTASATDWVARYGQAWVERDPTLAVTLFSNDAIYHQTPFGPHFGGHDEIARYWADITEAESDVTYVAGEPVVAGLTVACEWWVTMIEHGAWTTLPGCLILLFDEDGLCRELREYWEQRPGVHPPFEGWGRT
jgi:hypothetical protein